MNATINAFPPLHAFNSSRSWALAAIVLLHVGFFWVLTHGLTIGGVTVIEHRTFVDLLPDRSRAEPRPEPPKLEPDLTRKHDVSWPGTLVLPPIDAANAPEQWEHPVVPEAVAGSGPGSAEPVTVEPAVDPRVGLTQPVYPSSEIRLGHTGTVILSVEVLENGRIGQVRIEQSSGYARLDESAVREARRWRMIPGTRDGVPTRMWKRVPITFRLTDQ